MYLVQIEHVQFARDDKRGEDGAVWMLILSPYLDDPCDHSCKVHPKMVHNYERQAFHLGPFGHRLDATPQEIAEHKANVWGWNGNRELPSLTPSFLAMEVDEKNKRIRPYRMHSYITQGKLQVLSDSTVVLNPDPVHCWNE